MTWQIYSDHMLSHGAGPLRSWVLSFDGNRYFPKRAIRLSIGGYGSERPWWRPHFKRYRGTATHFGFGSWSISLVGLGRRRCRGSARARGSHARGTVATRHPGMVGWSRPGEA